MMWVVYSIAFASEVQKQAGHIAGSGKASWCFFAKFFLNGTEIAETETLQRAQVSITKKVLVSCPLSILHNFFYSACPVLCAPPSSIRLWFLVPCVLFVDSAQTMGGLGFFFLGVREGIGPNSFFFCLMLYFILEWVGCIGPYLYIFFYLFIFSFLFVPQNVSIFVLKLFSHENYYILFLSIKIQFTT